MKNLRLLLTSVFVLPLCMGLSGCPDDGAAEEAGENVDEAIDDAGDAMDDAADNTKDAVEETGDNVEDATDGGN